MNPEIKAEWVAALRSGEYKQGRSYLGQRLDDEMYYCCLGVLCEVTKERLGIQAEEVSEVVHYQSRNAYPPYRVMDFAGLIGLNVLINGEEHSFADLNDHARLTFDQIADLIEYFL
jgi:hypothetical protein